MELKETRTTFATSMSGPSEGSHQAVYAKADNRTFRRTSQRPVALWIQLEAIANTNSSASLHGSLSLL